jgi:hypothetical protein
MRNLISLSITFAAIAGAANAQDRPSALDRQISDALREVHDEGGELYNAGDRAGGYRMYQGGLLFAKSLLGHRPELQRTITNGMKKAEAQPAVDRRAFMLHELIEQVRKELKNAPGKPGEHLTVPPREVKPKVQDPKPSAGVSELKDGVIGRVVWQGAPVANVDVTFVSLGILPPRVYEGSTGAQGVYVLAEVNSGRYVVLISSRAQRLPERYATSTTSPLVIDVKGNGEKLDFMLQ